MRGFREWKWHLDEMYVRINGGMHYLWRAVDHEGENLESYVTKKRDKSAVLAFMKKRRSKCYGPWFRDTERAFQIRPLPDRRKAAHRDRCPGERVCVAQKCTPAVMPYVRGAPGETMKSRPAWAVRYVYSLPMFLAHRLMS